MDTQPNPHDAAIDKTLAALNSAPTPEGLESRIAARIAHRLQEPAPIPASRWLHRFPGPTLPSAWWSGAATGAAGAVLAVAAVLLLQHKTPPHGRAAVTANPANSAPTVAPAQATGSTANPCVRPAVLRAYTPTKPPVEIAAPSHPAPAEPLTAQERELVRLAQTAGPDVLASLNSATQAKLEAQDEAEFDKFFTPPPPPPPPPDQPSANTDASSPVNPEGNPAPASEMPPQTIPESQSANPETSPAAN